MTLRIDSAGSPLPCPPVTPRERQRVRPGTVIGARNLAGTKLPQNVLTKILSQFGPLPHVLQEAPRMAEIGLPRAGRLAAQAHFLTEPLDVAVDEARRRGCLRAREGGWVLAPGVGHPPPRQARCAPPRARRQSPASVRRAVRGPNVGPGVCAPER